MTYLGPLKFLKGSRDLDSLELADVIVNAETQESGGVLLAVNTAPVPAKSTLALSFLAQLRKLQ
jgi:hypothetical protein